MRGKEVNQLYSVEKEAPQVQGQATPLFGKAVHPGPAADDLTLSAIGLDQDSDLTCHIDGQL
jgi:hypothetical protein